MPDVRFFLYPSSSHLEVHYLYATFCRKPLQLGFWMYTGHLSRNTGYIETLKKLIWQKVILEIMTY